MRTSTLAAGIALLWISTALGAQAQLPHTTLRIGLWTLWHDKQIVLSPIPGGLTTLRQCDASAKCISSPLKQQITIHATADRLGFAEHSSRATVQLTGPVLLSAHNESIDLRNPIRISARNGQLVLAVTLPIEAYIERVTASESGPADTAESLKALAIVVRTFALHVKHNHADYDLCDSTHCQLLHWGTASARANAAHAATLATAGETLWFHHQRAAAWFHQDCGGHTASPSEVWPAKNKSISTQTSMPWLKAQVDNYCTAKGAREWSATLTLAELTAALSNAGLVHSGWKTLAVQRRGESDRAVTLRIGATELSAEDFRLAIGRSLGWNKILSTWFEVTHQASSQNASTDTFTFHGRGSGHGVGLCQTRSAAMAAQGRDATQILAQYFPGAEAADESTGLPWQTLHAQSLALQTLTASDAAYLTQLSDALAHAQAISGLKPTASITIRAFHSTSAFRDSTGAPGFTAAFTEGNWIATQPLAILASRKLLAPVLTHEFLHALVETQALPSAPLWLREGLVEAWSDPEQITSPAHAPPAQSNPNLEQLNHALAHPTTESESESAHRAAGRYAQALLDRFGHDQVLSWLHSGLPTSAFASLR